MVKIWVIKKNIGFLKKTYLFIYSSKKHRLSDSQPQKSRYKDTKVYIYILLVYTYREKAHPQDHHKMGIDVPRGCAIFFTFTSIYSTNVIHPRINHPKSSETGRIKTWGRIKTFFKPSRYHQYLYPNSQYHHPNKYIDEFIFLIINYDNHHQ